MTFYYIIICLMKTSYYKFVHQLIDKKKLEAVSEGVKLIQCHNFLQNTLFNITKLGVLPFCTIFERLDWFYEILSLMRSSRSRPDFNVVLAVYWRCIDIVSEIRHNSTSSNFYCLQILFRQHPIYLFSIQPNLPVESNLPFVDEQVDVVDQPNG